MLVPLSTPPWPQSIRSPTASPVGMNQRDVKVSLLRFCMETVAVDRFSRVY